MVSSAENIIAAVNSSLEERRMDNPNPVCTVGRLFPIAGTSITHRLISRSLTGRSMNLQIHNHFGHKIHITWNAHSYPLWAESENDETNKYMTTIAKTSSICLERKDIFKRRILNIVDSLKSNPIPGVCSCVWGSRFPWKARTSRKFPRCENMALVYSTKWQVKPFEWEIKRWQDRGLGKYSCTCKILSSEYMYDEIRVRDFLNTPADPDDVFETLPLEFYDLPNFFLLDELIFHASQL
jgi:hypothetical protein